ncbi:MAG: Nif3-like dinuclear metal center hexameric protein [Butyrivibrio sp.]|nr:Nif3-like dinuclear metal center hexameric protein [Butyrivibrio sp.]
MKAVEIAELLEKFSPSEYACEWDNPGMNVGRDENEVKKLLVCLDIDDAAVEYALKNGADMIVAHHPLIFHGLKKINGESPVSRRILTLAENRVNAFCMHTNFDCTHMAAEAARRLGLKTESVLEEVRGGKGIGAVGTLERAVSAAELAGLVKERFGLEHIVMYGNPEAAVERAVIVPGSGKDEIDLAVSAGAQALVTGDITYHYGTDAAARNIVIIDAGHYGLEHIFTDITADYLERRADNVGIMRMPFNNPQKYF